MTIPCCSRVEEGERRPLRGERHLGFVAEGVTSHRGVGGRGRVWTDRYTLDGFQPKSSDLTREHREWIVRIAWRILESHEQGAPLVRVSVTGHAAFFWEEPDPAVPYAVWASLRAQEVSDALAQDLAARSAPVGPAQASAGSSPGVIAYPRTLLSCVDLQPADGRDVSEPIDSNLTRAGRARNRRAEVTLSEVDPRKRPWRWICAIRADFGGRVLNPYNLNEGGTTTEGSGVLISDRHVLTASHLVRQLRRPSQGNTLLWTQPERVRVIPAQRGWAHQVQRPFGEWRAKKVTSFPGFAAPVTLQDYHQPANHHRLPLAPLENRLRLNDLAIIELEPRHGKAIGYRRLAGQGIFGWWGQSPPFALGFGPDLAALKRLGRRSSEARACGYTDALVDEVSRYDGQVHPKFSKGSAWRGTGYGQPGLLLSHDLWLHPGQSGCPWWMNIDGTQRLVGIHRGDVVINWRAGGRAFRAQVESAVLLSPSKVLWLQQVTS